MTTTKALLYYTKKLLCTIFLVLTSVLLYLICYKTRSDSIVVIRVTSGDTLKRLINESGWLQESMTAKMPRTDNHILLDMKNAGLIATRQSVRQIIPRVRINDAMVVPNVVHYVWLGTDLKFKFIQYLSFLSVHRYIKPDFIFVHGEVGPTPGQWWNRTKQEVHNIYHVVAKVPEFAPSGRRFLYEAHQSDFLRVQTLYNFGGIYMDADVLVIKSFDPLRRYPTVMGRESFHGVCNGVILSAKHAPFTWMLVEQYKDYTGFTEWWSYRSVLVPHMLAAKFPELIHVEETSLNRPNWYELDKIYYEHYNWSENYAMHMWFRSQGKKDPRRLPKEPADIDCVETTFGEIARHIFYGSKSLHCGS